MGIVLVGFRCVSGKQVFVLVSGCRMFGRQDKEGVVGKWDIGRSIVQLWICRLMFARDR